MFWLAGYTGRVFFPGIHLEQELNTSFRDKAPFLFDTCQAVYDKQEEMVAPERRRLAVAKAGAAGAAVVAHGEPTGVVTAAVDLPWTERGGVVVDDLAPFEVKHLGAVFILWFAFSLLAIALAVWSNTLDRHRRAAKRAKIAKEIRASIDVEPKEADMVDIEKLGPIIEAAMRNAMSTTFVEVQATASSNDAGNERAATSSQD